MKTIIYPNLIAELGGATAARVGKRSVEVQAHGRVYRMPLSEAKLYLDDGIKLADIAKAWAYRSA